LFCFLLYQIPTEIDFTHHAGLIGVIGVNPEPVNGLAQIYRGFSTQVATGQDGQLIILWVLERQIMELVNGPDGGNQFHN